MKEARAGTWSLAWSDVPAGALGLVRLVHPLLPDFGRMRVSPVGFLLDPAPSPGPLAEAGEPGPFLVRLLGLAAFLAARGLGMAPADLAALGTRGGRPVLGAPPVPAWRSLSPALVTAAAAARLSGERLPTGSAGEVRAAVERAPLRGKLRDIAHAALRAEACGRTPEALLHAMWEEFAPDEALGSDLLGLVLPDIPPFSGDPRIDSACGGEALLLARASARRGAAGFVEVGAGPVLTEGGALSRLADALDSDARSAGLRELARGGKAELPAGPAVALVARSFERWDRRSRQVWEEDLAGFARVEARAALPAPWERRRLLELPVGVAEAASLVWLPFGSLADAVGFWERLARSSRGDLSRLLAGARQAALAMRPGVPIPRLAPERRASQAVPPALVAAASLLDGFSVAEAALASGGTAAEAEEALGSALAAGELVETAPHELGFASEERRRALAAKPGAAARRALVSRLGTLPEERRVAAALARGDPEDIEAAGSLLCAAVQTDRLGLALALLARAPSSSPFLGAPLHALVALSRAGKREDAVLAVTAIPRNAEGPLALRAEAARALVRLGLAGRATGLVPSNTPPEEALARARVLLDLHRTGEAARLLRELPARLSLPSRIDSLLLSAEVAGREKRYAQCAAALRRAGRLLSTLAAGSLHAEAVRTAGLLASDLGKTDEAFAFFRRARDEARGPEARADAIADLAVTAHHAGRLDEAARQTDAALAAFAGLGDRERYVSVLGNRADLHLASGDAAAARRDLDIVLAHDRAKGREYQLLFALPTLQRLCLAEGDLGGAERAYTEAAALGQPESHDAWREALVMEGKRLLMERRPSEAAARLAQVASLTDNRVQNESLRARLAASAAVDMGTAVDVEALPESERRLFDVERALGRGHAPIRSALDGLRRAPGGSFLAAERLVEWSMRFPREIARESALVRLGTDCARRAGLSDAESLLLGILAPEASAVATRLPEPPAPTDAVAEDPAMRALLGVAARIAPTTLPVLILGESGTGKEVLARRLHALSKRRGAFVAVNVAALTPTLVESELFGHAKGAFTGAERERAGLVEASSGGTLFLDEIGDLPLAIQAKLLRVLQERELVRVGETRPRKVDLRVLAATHRPLAAMAREGTFRFDLYQRIAGVTLEIPPLRERPKDLAALVSRGLDGARAAPEVRRLLLSHAWPGNVRELLSALEAARALAGGATIGPEHLPPALRKRVSPEGQSYKSGLKAARERLITDALDASGGNRTHAAKRLGLSRQSLLYEIRKLGL